LNAVWAALFALASEAPRYPLPQATPGTDPPPGVSVVDVAYAMSDQPRVVQHASARLRLGDRAFAGAFVRNQERGLLFRTHRIDADFAEEQGRYEGGVSYRAPRLRLAARAVRPAEDGPRDLALEAGARLGIDTELSAELLEEGRSLPFPSPYREAALRLDRQGDHGLEMTVRASRQSVPSPAGFTFNRYRLDATGARGLGPAEVEAEGGYERTTGRLRANEAFGGLTTRIPVWSRLLLEAGSRVRWEPGVSVSEREHTGALSLHARRIRLPRTGVAAGRTIALAREANRRGSNLRVAYDDLGRRALRERASLSPDRDALAGWAAALHEAQVAERLVPLAGIEVTAGTDHVRGSRSRLYRAFVGAPWPLGLPGTHDEQAVPFLRLSYAYRETLFDVAPRTVDEDAALEVELNREHLVVLSWSRPGRTPLDLARVTATASSWRVAYVYARGR
jgi:hypothetical protein